MNSNNNLVKYEKQYEVITFSKKKYYIPKSKLNELLSALNTKKFVSIQGSIINVSSIDTIDPASRNDDFVEEKIKSLDIDLKRKIRDQIALRKTKIITELTPGTLENIIKSLTHDPNKQKP